MQFLKKLRKNVKKHRDIKLMTINQRRSYLVSQPNYHTTKWFRKNLLEIEMKKKKNSCENKQASTSRFINTRNQ